MRVSQGQRRRAQDRTRAVLAEVETAIADKAKLTGDVLPGVNEADYLAVYADELTRHSVPNRADRRRAARSR